MLLNVGKPLPARVDGNEHLSCAPAQLVVERVLDAALAGVLHADGAHYLSCKIASRIEALRLFLKMDTLQVQRLDAFDGFIVGFARNPAKSFVVAAIGEDYVVVLAGDAGNQGNRRGQVFYFGGDGECRIHEHGHCQLMTGTVVYDAAFGGERNLALLLMLGLLGKGAVTENLQINQAHTDRDTPKQKHGAQKVKPGVLAGIGVGRHGNQHSAISIQHSEFSKFCGPS